MYYYGTATVNDKGHLEIGGLDTIELVKKYGTPLYVYDVALIRQRARSFKETFEKHNMKAQVSYASKAFSSLAMVQLADEEGLSLDVVSGGELYTAIAAGFPMERVHFHGNNKSKEELIMALDHKIGYIVVDNFYELELLDALCAERKQRMEVVLRITPGIEAHTHDYIMTAQADSKFGLDLQQAEDALQIAMQSSWLVASGIHCHIGSQIFETTGFKIAVQKIFEKLAHWKESLSFEASILNLGGGFGIRYTSEDEPKQASEYVTEIIMEVKKQAENYNLSVPEIGIEPGRSLVGDAGITLYKIGSSKEVPDVRKYIAIDGGMTDNIRPALYQAKYEAVLANKPLEQPAEVVSIAGKCCESGDMLIWDLPLPHAGDQDILAVFCTGAYGYSMANNYNRIPRPPVVFVENSEAKLVVKRETYEDLVHLDVPLKETVKAKHQ